MPPTLQFPWLNKGEPFELPDIPMAGDDELDALTDKHAKTVVLQRRGYLLQRLLSILAIKRLVEMGHAERARRAWEEALLYIEPAQSRGLYEWPTDRFVEEFNTYFHIEVEQRYQVEGLEAANTFLQSRLKDLEEETANTTLLSDGAFQKEHLVTGLYWRLKTRFKIIERDGGEQLPLTKENLRTVIRIPTDSIAYLMALAQSRSKNQEKEREEIFEEETEESVKKNLQKVERSSKQSKTGSPSTSASGTATVRP